MLFWLIVFLFVGFWLYKPPRLLWKPSELTKVNQVIKVLPQCMEAMRIWMGMNCLQLNLTEAKGLWMLGPGRSGHIPSLTLDRIALPPFKSSMPSEGHLGFQLLPDEQVAAVASKTFVQLHLMHQLHHFLDWESSRQFFLSQPSHGSITA